MVMPRMEITDREVLYRSDIHFTPILNHDLIDATAVSMIVEKEYQRAGLSSTEIDTGAVIITGETAKKENAKKILEKMAGLAGDFVVATAGVNLESILAGKGSGASSYSKEKHVITANIDIGGGTSNIGVFKEGQTLDTACINIGGRLIELEKNSDKITYITEPARRVLKECGLSLVVGEKITFGDLKKITATMAQSVLETVTTRELSSLTSELMMTPHLRLDYHIEKISISGGVADYVYNNYRPITVSDVSKYGDIGPLLGYSIRETFQSQGIALIKPAETIRATVIGAGIHSVNISGSTIHVNETTLPLRNIAVISPFPGEVPQSVEDITSIVRREVERLTLDGSVQYLALAIKGPKTNTFTDIQVLAEGIAKGMKDYLRDKKPLILVLEMDCGKVLGQCLEIILKNSVELVVIDQVSVNEGDYIDIGKPIMGGIVVPVVVKTLVFENPGIKD
ncbi:MAG: ethanolamine utilization protein EutA [Clostridia bacterium]|jgi:ethanolamine utilization protein EutA|nr:ethanolamine utilization protein EutA [Clostridia bacterium]